jgi:EAL domain-containing protein (putative c-di-GMP-specific phosphodiesterase class I)
MDLVSDLHGAVGRGEIVAYYQPQVELDTLEIVAAEAIARWMHPEFGLVGPGIFIPLAEAHELIAEIDEYMMDEGIRCATEWDALGLDIEVAVNVSAAQLTDLAFLDRLQRNLGAAQLPPDKIVIEITESLPVMHVDAVAARLLELRELGLGVSIDDFGDGYSTLPRRAGIPANEIKLDKSLIQDPHASRALLDGIVREAHRQGLRVLAEGVETEGHLALARGLSCDRAQGFLFGRPAPPEAIVKRLRLFRPGAGV